ncbi:HLA class II histocompatibility antigen, DP alpha 1 chain-like isoform X3 [Stegastes partitus]|uniref:HLA class II histocompatibility antigen, DP alpha 1 chain-like n=1 Tax=Stegastes partitus TaxID=144197 RepID=A0A3B5A0Y4_9TELE|nr:PREDICTED: HLA class II histocompatibility antigen, DP alpha 1 chain-like isoform X2 [Stegastes partitus]XP_008291231.1 PREDICTED: HLA class II histocompatibility antigen, DP alpha 1 chain-like isoform X3 [Stegastes partitus]
MVPSVILLLLAAGAGSATTSSHQLRYMYGCYESDDVRVDAVLDEDVIGYADFNKEEMVIALPDPPQSVEDFKKRAIEFANADRTHCHNSLGRAKAADPGSPMQQDPPDIFMYTRYEGEEDVINTLYCLANYFYPPTINFTWSKNGMEVTEGVTNLRYRHNDDGTFHRISTLSFTPREGDFYTCKVEHQASQQPLTRTWELKKRSSVSPAAVFFFVSLVLCLMGIGTGVYFLNKQPS